MVVVLVLASAFAEDKNETQAIEKPRIVLARKNIPTNAVVVEGKPLTLLYEL